MDESPEMPAENPVSHLETQPKETPIYDAGIFTITHLAHSSEGLTVKNADEYDGEGNVIEAHQLRRKDLGSPLPLTRDNPETGKEGERTELAKGMQGEMKFAKGLDAKEELQKLRQGEHNSHIYEKKRQEYVAKMRKPKIRLTKISQEEDTVTVDTRPVSFPLYDLFATRENADRQDLMDMSEVLGTCAIIITKDNKAILQYRGKGNRKYKNIPGASAAGLMDGELENERNVKGVLKPITRESIVKHLTKEATEELQIDENKLRASIVGIAHDQISPHHEFMLLGEIDETSTSLAEKGLIPDDMEGHDFKERYFTIDATPEAFEKLLTEVKCPLPPTHASNFFMAGLEMVRRQHEEEYAREWAQNLAEKIKLNYKEIDRMANNGTGYDPKLTPEEQGLPSLLPELERVGLISLAMHEKLRDKYIKAD